MVDKVWYDWQHRNPENAKSYFGGSVQALDSVASYNQYPNGGPPFLNVRSFSLRVLDPELKRCACVS
jgi:tyrosinase